MRLRQALQAIVVLAAVFVGVPATAFAHAGHVHASPAPKAATAHSAVQLAVAPSTAQAAFQLEVQSPSRDHQPISDSPASNLTSTPAHGNMPCLPGVCCCHGPSLCGAGSHCCSTLMPQHSAWLPTGVDSMRFRLARLGRDYPEMLFGLDRPPKA